MKTKLALIGAVIALSLTTNVQAATVKAKVARTSMGCTNSETFDGLKMVEGIMGPEALKAEIENVLNNGSCVILRRGDTVRVDTSSPKSGVMGGEFYPTNKGYVPGSNLIF